MEIYVKMFNGRIITLEVEVEASDKFEKVKDTDEEVEDSFEEPKDAFDEIKAKFQEKEGIPPEQQRYVNKFNKIDFTFLNSHSS
jgi:alpha-glucuronidase